MAASVAGCIDIDGGSVEARWVLRTGNGIALTCDDDRARIGGIRFVLDPREQDGGVQPDPCGDDDRCLFSCDRGVGTTPFFVPEGFYAISLQAVDIDGSPLGQQDGVVVPSSQLRWVRTGELTNLNVNLIVVER